jgi:hypothetical protein
MEIVVFNKPSTPSLCKKIIAHLPINKIIAHLPINAPILKGVPLLPPLEDDIEEHISFMKAARVDNSNINWVKGYNKAKEKYQFTLEDLKKAIDMAWILAQEEESIFSAKEKIIQSLQQQKYPVGFECEMGKIYGCEDPKVCLRGCHVYDNSCKHPRIDKTKPKTITNSQGQTQLVGTYIYE